MGEVKLVPEVRFPEYEDVWIRKRLDEIAKIERGRFSPRPRNNPIYYNGNVPFVQTGDVVHSNGKIINYSQTLNEEGLKVSKLFPKGTILITIAANIGYSGVLQMDMACPDSLIGLTCKSSSNNYFLNYLLLKEQPKIDYLAVSAAQKNINIEFLKPYKFILPSLPEQQKIATFLSSIDERIQLLEKKKQGLEEYKKGVMKKIFSQEIRFKDENGNDYPDWENKKLGKVCNIAKGKQLNKEELTASGLYPCQNGGIEPSGYTELFNTEKNTITISEGGNSCGYVNLLTTRFWCGGHCYSLLNVSNEMNNDFLFQYLKHFQRYIMRLRVGSGLPNIQKKDIVKYKIEQPHIEEQQKIASFLSSIDDSIEQAAQQIEHSKTYKKGLLQKMFV